MRPLQKLYVEITNECNLACPFCPAHSRPRAAMSRDQFRTVLDHIRGQAATLYFHVKGEPLLHPDLRAFLELAGQEGFRVRITTNGTLLAERKDALAGQPCLDRLQVSFHSLAQFSPAAAADIAKAALSAIDVLLDANRKVNPRFLVSLRLWTRDDAESTAQAASLIERQYGLADGFVTRSLAGRNSVLIAPGIAVHAADTFVWPSLGAPETGNDGFCLGLRDQAAILADGVVVPCCLDGDGVIALGNIFSSTLSEIRAAPRARALYDGFSGRKAVEPLCRRCGYRSRFTTGS